MKKKEMKLRALQYLSEYKTSIYSGEFRDGVTADHICTRAVAASDAFLELGLISGFEQEAFETLFRHMLDKRKAEEAEQSPFAGLK